MKRSVRDGQGPHPYPLFFTLVLEFLRLGRPGTLRVFTAPWPPRERNSSLDAAPASATAPMHVPSDRPPHSARLCGPVALRLRTSLGGNANTPHPHTHCGRLTALLLAHLRFINPAPPASASTAAGTPPTPPAAAPQDQHRDHWHRRQP